MRASRILFILTAISLSAGGPAVAQDGVLPINGTELFVERIGTGEPIVVVHGGPVLEHGYFLPHLEPLSEDYELVFYDQRLSGRSAPTVALDSVRLATFVEDIEALRVSLGLDRIHLMGHSWGGLLAMRYAIDHGEHLRSLMLLDSMSASSTLWKEEQALLSSQITAEDRARQQAIRESEAFVARQPEAIREMLLESFALQFHDRARLDALDLFVPDDYSSRSEQFGGMMVDLSSFDFHDELANIDAPVLILYGESEPGREIGGAALARALPEASVVTIDDAGHFPFIEQPESFLREVRAFLRRTK